VKQTGTQINLEPMSASIYQTKSVYNIVNFTVPESGINFFVNEISLC